MKLKVSTFIFCFAVFVCINAPSAYAENRAREAHDEGSHKLSFGGSMSSTDQYDAEGTYIGTQNQFSTQLGYGYFFADSWEFGFGACGSKNWTNESDTEYGYFTANMLLKYYFVGESNVVPYLGIMGGRTWTFSGDKTYKSMSGGASVGFEWLVTDNTSLFLEYNITSYDEKTSYGVTNKGVFGVTYHF